MKILICSLLFVLATSSCTLNSGVSDYSNQVTISGTWIWQKSTGGLTGSDLVTPVSTGETRKLVFTNGDKVTAYTNSVETGNYTYQIVIGKGIFDEKDQYLLKFNEMTYVIEYIDHNNLILDNNFPDGYRITYRR